MITGRHHSGGNYITGFYFIYIFGSLDKGNKRIKLNTLHNGVFGRMH